MKREHKNEILFLYIGYFVTLAVGLIPNLSWYAVGALALQVFYAIIRYVSTSTSELVFRSHALNYVLGVGISFIVGILITVQAQAINMELGNIFFSFGFGSKSGSANSFPYLLFMIGLEFLFAIFWPIVLISRGLYLIDSPRPILGAKATGASLEPARPLAQPDDRQQGGAESITRIRTERWLASAVMANGRIVQFEINTSAPTRVIGRDTSEADIVVNDDSVSRRHARIDLKDGAIWISDLGSLNRTKVNGRDIGFNPIPLNAADKIQLGSVTLTISAA